MPLLTHGFLGADAGQARKQILRKYSQLFAVLRELNDVSHEYLRGLRLDLQNEFHIFTVTYFIRGLSTFQSLIILLEHGCIDDARALCRTLLHTHFRLAAIAAKPSVLNRIRATGISEAKKRLESYKIGQRKIPPGSRSVDLDAQIKAAEVQLKKLGRSEITEKQLAEIGGCDYDIQYAVLSDASHGSLFGFRTIGFEIRSETQVSRLRLRAKRQRSSDIRSLRSRPSEGEPNQHRQND